MIFMLFVFRKNIKENDRASNRLVLEWKLDNVSKGKKKEKSIISRYFLNFSGEFIKNR